ncbi:MAG TPA: VOC family protein [Candidatus Nesterenkonia stercoripullorum]|uniref:VOC family protein n=1 Tax=Candidatus Nesterenkonia stercoripullorum TaxID=2838701 RepID=A0A9D1URD4_9MICC|nr:VOC family protein [Candidatus Nesterenkonia stercoripullorum]
MPESLPQLPPERLDHIVVTTDDLDAGLALIEESTGVRLEPGGVHPDFGTRNYLATFGPTAYLELIGVDEENTEFSGTRPFRIDTATTTSTATWAITCEDLEATVAAARDAGLEPGDPEPKSRRRPDGSLLEWRLTRNLPEPTGVVPFLLDWQGATTPAQTTEATLELVAFHAWHLEPQRIRPVLQAYGTDLIVEPGEPGLRVTVEGPAGRITL